MRNWHQRGISPFPRDLLGIPQIITATVNPALAVLTSLDDPIDGYSAGTFASTAGNITTAVVAWNVDENANQTSGTAVSFTVTVSDDAGTTPRVFGPYARTVVDVTVTATTAAFLDPATADDTPADVFNAGIYAIDNGATLGTQTVIYTKDAFVGTILGTATLAENDVLDARETAPFTTALGNSGSAVFDMDAVTVTAGALASPTFSVQPTISTGVIGDTLTITEGTAGPSTTLTIEEFTLATVDKSGELIGLTWDTTGESAGQIRFRVRATNATGFVLSNVITYDLAAAAVLGDVVMPADTPVGTGGAALVASDGDYGEYTVASNVVTPRISPLTLGDTSINGTVVSAVRVGDLDVAAATEQEIIDLAPYSLSNATTPNARILVRPGVAISRATMDTFRGGFPRPNPYTLNGVITLEGELTTGAATVTVESFDLRNTLEGGYFLKNLLARPDVGRSAFMTVTGADTISLKVQGMDHRGAVPFDTSVDYHAYFPFTGKVGTFIAGEYITSSAAPDTTIANQMIYRDEDIAGNIRFDNGTSGGRTPSANQYYTNGATVTGVTSGATATISGAIVNPLPENPEFINSGPGLKSIDVRDCTMQDFSGAGIVAKARDSIYIDNVSAYRFVGDAFKIISNAAGIPNPTVTCRRTDTLNGVGASSYLNNPHSDAFQIQRSATFPDWIQPFLVEFNRILDGNSQAEMQAMFFQNDPNRFEDITFRANLIGLKNSVHGITLSVPTVVGMSDCHHNSVVAIGDGLEPTGLIRGIYFGGDRSRIAKNTADRITWLTEAGTVVLADNATRDINGVSSGLERADIHTGLGGANPWRINTFADLMTAAVPAPARDQTIGARGTDVDWVNYTVNETGLPAIPSVDTIAPILSGVSVTPGTTTAVLSWSTDEGNGTAYWMVDANATRTAEQIKTGGGTASGSASVTASGAQTNITATGLTASTPQYFHLMHEDAATNQSTASSTSFTTSAADVTAPTLSSPTDEANGATASTASVSTDEANGTLYTAVTTSATAPTAAQVKLGQDNSSVAAAFAGSQAVSATGVQTISPAPSGLTPSTANTTHFMHEDAAGNQSAVSSASGFTTAAGGAYTQNFVDTNGTGWFQHSSAQAANSAQWTFSAWVNPNDLSGSVRLWDCSGRGAITMAGDKLTVFVKDSANFTVYDAITTNAVFNSGTLAHIGIQIDLSVELEPSIEIKINGVAPAMTGSTAIAAGNGLVALARTTGLLAYNTGAGITDAMVSDIYLERSAAVSLATLYNGGTPPDLSAVGSPYIFLGDTQVASNWNAFENLGTATLVAGSGTFTDV